MAVFSASNERVLLVLRALPANDTALSNVEVAKLTKVGRSQVGAVMKMLYDSGAVWRVFERRMGWVYSSYRSQKTICHRLTAQGRRMIEQDDEHRRVSHESGFEEGQPARVLARRTPDGDDRADGVACSGGDEPACETSKLATTRPC